MPIFERNPQPKNVQPITINVPMTGQPQTVNVPAPVPQQGGKPSGQVVGGEVNSASPPTPKSPSRRSIVVPVVS